MAFISINSNTIRSNAQHHTSNPPIRIAKTENDIHPTYANEVNIKGPCRLVYDPHETMLRCGARLALVVDFSDIEVVS